MKKQIKKFLLIVLVGCGSSAPKTSATNACTTFTDSSAASASRTISFGGANGSPATGYSPNCMTIAVGQTVTFSGDFTAHPLSPGTEDGNTAGGSANSPIVVTSTGSSTTFTFSAAGDFPYFCQVHRTIGMVGDVHVQ